MRPGTYRDRNGVLVTVRRTPSGLTVTYPNGDVVAVSAR